MSDAEDVRDDGNGAAERDVSLDPACGDAVGEDDEGREPEEPRETARDGEGHWTVAF
jgi:hypothetical protein